MNPPPSPLPDWYRDIQEAGQDPSWPPLPTLGGGTAPLDSSASQALPIRPRQSAPDGQQAAGPGAPPRTMRFDCPACLGALEVPVAFAGQPGPCPHCHILIAPPRLVDPAELALPQQLPRPQQTQTPPRDGPEGRFRPDRTKAEVRWVKGEIRTSSPRDLPSPPRPPR